MWIGGQGLSIGCHEELTDTDNMEGVCPAAVEFINMMTETGSLPTAAEILRYVESTGPTWATLVARRQGPGSPARRPAGLPGSPRGASVHAPGASLSRR
jgi:hypothetical protein